MDTFKPQYNYDLRELLEHHGVTPVVNDSEVSCKHLVDLFVRTRGKHVVAKNGVAEFKVLPQTVYTNRQVPDVTIYINGHIIIVIEVHSCTKSMSFINSIKKTILGLIDVLRYYKGLHPTSSGVTQCVGFTFPKLGGQTCVVQVSVEFKNLQFSYKLKSIPLGEVKDAVLTVVSANHQRFKPFFSEIPKSSYNFFVTLSQEELKMFQHFCKSDEKAVQFPSKEAILICCGGLIWKFPGRCKDNDRLRSVSKHLKEHSYLISMKRYTTKKTDDSYFNGRGWYYYEEVEHNPLVADEAKDCIADFVEKLCSVLEKLHHTLNAVHLDLRLENIAFNEGYSLVLLDLDRFTELPDFSHGDILAHSCIYMPFCDDLDPEEQGRMNDWRQVAFLLFWTFTWQEQLMNGKTYHNQDTTISNSIVKEPFFKELVEGKCLPYTYHT